MGAGMRALPLASLGRGDGLVIQVPAPAASQDGRQGMRRRRRLPSPDNVGATW